MAQRILIVDDDEDIKYLVKSTLHAEGYEVITAANGEEALGLIGKHVPDLMLVDLTMPIMNGWTFSMKAREDARYKHTPIIIFSALLEREAAGQKFEAGTYYIPKPFDVFKLVEKIKELLKAPKS